MGFLMVLLSEKDEEIVLFMLEKEYCKVVRDYNKSNLPVEGRLLKLEKELQNFLKKELFSDNGKNFIEGLLLQTVSLHNKAFACSANAEAA